MSKKADAAYYGVRAAEEGRRSEDAAEPRSAAVHADLAARYKALSIGT